MRLNRSLAVFLAILTMAPWAYIVILVTYIMPRLESIATAGTNSEEGIQQLLNTLFYSQMAFVVLILLLTVFYIAHVFRLDRVPAEKKALWVGVLFFGNLLAMPVYWYFYVWPRQGDYPHYQRPNADRSGTDSL